MTLHQSIQGASVSELSLRNPLVVTPHSSLREAIEKMRDAALGCAIVLDGQNKPVGMLTESMLTQLLAKSPQCIEDAIEGQIAKQWPWVTLTDPIAHVLDAMQLKNVRLLCVVDDDGRLAGITGQRGLMEFVANHLPGVSALQRIGESAVGDRNSSAPRHETQAADDRARTTRDSLEEALDSETVGAIQHEPYVTIAPVTPVHEATNKLAGLHVACLLVAEGERLLGVFSERDVLNKVALEYDDVKDRCVSEVMTSHPVYVHETDSPAVALSVMAISGYRHVPVLNSEDQLVGIVSPQRVMAFLKRFFEE